MSIARKFEKSPERLAMEIIGKPSENAYKHLRRYSLTRAEAAEVVALFKGIDGKLYGAISEIASAIKDAILLSTKVMGG
ncbi:MAG: hypothetical protein DRG83_19845 [Deltaproteobacteria bacterium]|nr:MAG: hypothetical protein DRG83_19845 [Deltaproteobacteria bacterium]